MSLTCLLLWTEEVSSTNNERKVSLEQIMALVFVSLLSPIIRLLPQQPAKIAFSAAWLSPIAAIIPSLLFMWLLTSIMKKRKEEEGLADVFMKAIGKTCGKIVLVLYALWLIFYTGFILRTAAERLLSSVYENGSITIFVVVTLIVAVIAAMGSIGGLARTGQVFAIIIGTTIVLATLFAVPNIKFENLLPVSYLDIGKIFLGALPIVNIATVSTYFAFLGGKTTLRQKESRVINKWVIIFTVAIFLIIFATIGTLSAQLAMKTQNPFFGMIREITILGIVERLESVVIGIWVFSDFVFIASMLFITTELFSVVFNGKKRQMFVPPVSIAALVVAFLIVNNAFELMSISDIIIPLSNVTFTLVILLTVFIIGKIRKKI